jgi:uncharacterized protein
LLNDAFFFRSLRARRVQVRFIALLKPPFKCGDDYRRIAGNEENRRTRQMADGDTVDNGDSAMARYEILDGSAAPLGEGPAAGDMLFELGIMYSIGREVPVDLISAHKWFNLAAMKGNNEAVRLRREIADQMSDGEIAIAQRAARDWLKGTARAPALAA